MAITYTTNLDLKNNRITNLGAPAMGSDGATKQYVDAVATGLVWKDTVRVATTANVNLAAPGSIDGVALNDGDRVLVMAQTDPVENGIYTFSGGTLTRSIDADTSAELRPGTAVSASEGTTNGNHTFVLVSDDPITVGTSPISFALMNAGTVPDYTEGDGIDITAHVVSAVPAPNGGVAVSASGIGVVADPAGGVNVGATGVGLTVKPNTGLAVDATGLSFVPKANFGLATDASGASVVIKPNTGLAVDASGVQTVIASNKGLMADASGLAVVSGNGIDTDAAGVKAVADPAGGLQVGASGIGTKLTSTSGLSSDASGLTTVARPNGGLSVDAAGIGVVASPNMGVSVDGTGVGVVIRPNDGLDVDGTGIGITTAPNGGLDTGVSGLGVVLNPNTGLAVDASGVSTVLDPAGGLAVDGTGIKAVAGLGVTVGADIAIDPMVVARRFAASVGDGAATSIAVTHNLNTRDVQVEVYSTSAPYDTVYTGVERTDANTVTLDFGSTPPTSGQYRCVVVG